MSATVPIELPLLGLNTLTPFLPFNSGYARELTNYSIRNGTLEMRPGVKYSAANGAIPGRMIWSNGVEIINEVGNRYNFTTGAALGVLSSYAFNRIPITLKYQGTEYIVGLGAPRNSVAPFGVWGITTAAITATAITSACAHKGRLYVCDGSTIEYTGLGQVAGAIPAANTFPISQFLQNEFVLRMFSVTALPGNETSNVFVIFGTGGTVLVYQGDYPADPNWELLGNFKMPAPFNEVAFAEVNGDIFIGTDQYCYWFRDLFTADAQTAYEKRPSKVIDNLWQSVDWSFSRGFEEEGHIWFYKPLNTIICQCFEKSALGKVANYDNEACYFVYFIEYKAWAIWFMKPMFAPIIGADVGSGIGAFGFSYSAATFKGLTSLSLDIFSNTLSYDEAQGTLPQQPIYTSWKTPYFQPEAGKNRQALGTKPFFYNAARGALNLIQAIYDLTDYNQPFGFWNQPDAIGGTNPENYTSGNILVNTNSNPIYSEFCGVSGNGASVSLQFTQAELTFPAANQPQKIYKASLLLTEGANYPA